MESVKFLAATVGSGLASSCIGNLASRIVTNKYPLSGAVIAGGTVGLTGGIALMTSDFVEKYAGENIQLIYIIGVGVVGAAALAPHIVKPLTGYTMSYYESGVYAALSTVAFLILCCALPNN